MKKILTAVNFIPILYLLVIVSFSFSRGQDKTEKEVQKPALKLVHPDGLKKERGALSKAGTELTRIFKKYKANELSQINSSVGKNSLVKLQDEKILVDITCSGDAKLVKAQLENLGMEVTGVAGPVISGMLPVSAIEQVASSKSIRFFRPSASILHSGLANSQGDASMNSDDARTANSVDGSGVTVGVISDSYDFLGTATVDVVSGDLPGTGNLSGHTTDVNVVEDDGDTDEGRAMLQIVHDIAPGASLAFATANGGQAGFAANIIALMDAGADVIVDDISYFAEPMFQDGIIAQAVDSVVSQGVAYFSSAGNSGSQSYQSVWRSSSNVDVGYGAEPAFDFNPGAGTDIFQSFTLNDGESVLIVLQWDSPFASVCAGCPGSQNDIDIYLINSTLDTIIAWSEDVNIDGDAVEVFSYTNTSGSIQTYNVLIALYEGAAPGFIKYVNFDYEQGSLEYATNSSTIYGHSNAVGAVAVGASAYFDTPAFGTNPPLLEYYSSTGPTAIRFDTEGNTTSEPRANKPQITAPDGVNTTFFGYDYETDGFPNFFGTSAAAPHAAAVAALMLDLDPSLTPSQIYSALEASAIDIGAPGFDNESGFGLIQADAAVPLPVELVSFNAVVKGTAVQLVWQTATELNNAGFEIQRKVISDPKDFLKSSNAKWENIAFVNGHGTVSTPQQYLYTDNFAGNAGAAIYRLRQNDNDGKFSYSSEVQVSFQPAEYSLEQNYPNPFNPSTTIRYSLQEESSVKIILYNMLGEKVADIFSKQETAGYKEVMFNASALSSGVYYYVIKAEPVSGGEVFNSVKKMMVLK